MRSKSSLLTTMSFEPSRGWTLGQLPEDSRLKRRLADARLPFTSLGSNPRHVSVMHSTAAKAAPRSSRFLSMVSIEC